MKAHIIAALVLGSCVAFVPMSAVAHQDNDHDHKKTHKQSSKHKEEKSKHTRAQRDKQMSERQIAAKRKQLHRWQRGHALPVAYRGQRYYVNNWRAASLKEPPRGYRWMKVNNDYLLVAITSHVIAQVLLNQ